MNYKISYEILNYEKYYNRLNSIMNNPLNRFPLERMNPIGKTKCGFDIQHFKIGNGPIHIVYMGGCHGNEIISVDYVTQLMNNIALGLSDYENFDPNEFTIDFIPCQNPEGFFTTTYALDYFMKDMNPEEIESFSKKYYLAYRQDDTNTITINKILNTFYNIVNPLIDKNILTQSFWDTYRNKEITITSIIDFLLEYKENYQEEEIKEIVKRIWEEKLELNYTIPEFKLHNKMFSELTIDCIPEIDDAHKNLKASLQKLYAKNEFPIGSLANFFSNASGVNLNDNNEYYYNEINSRLKNEEKVYGNLRDNNLCKSIPGPIGIPSENLNEPFKYSEENEALLNFLAKQEEQNFAFINCHGTGGLFFLYPVAEEEKERRFQFYINNRIATEYTKETGRVYEEYTGKNTPYVTQGHPERITGIGDLLRKKYLGSFLLELSKAGGNPIAPYCDINGNYKLTMLSNFRANAKLMETILEVKHLYDTTYTVEYVNGQTIYTTKRTK